MGPRAEFKRRFDAIPDTPRKQSAALKRELFRDMRKFGMCAAEIARLIGRHHSTVLAHMGRLDK